MGGNNKAHLRTILMRGNNETHQMGSQVPLLDIEVTNTVDNLEDVLSNAIQIVYVGSGVRMPIVILPFLGNRLLLRPKSHV